MKQYHIHLATSDKKFTETEVQPREYAGFVEANSLDDAYVKSQNDAYTNEEEQQLNNDTWNPLNPCRSCSVGDIIQDSSKFYMVLGSGFKLLFDTDEIEPEEKEPELEYPQ